jgi:hypothetical protein
MPLRSSRTDPNADPATTEMVHPHQRHPIPAAGSEARRCADLAALVVLGQEVGDGLT